MTANQLAYWNLQETKRSNLEKEAQGRTGLAETGRHNRATESLEGSKQAETMRHNKASENLIGLQTAETARSNRAREAETQRSNLAREKETKRSNLVAEANATLDRRSRESIASKDRASREDIASKERDTRYNIAAEDREQKYYAANLQDTRERDLSRNELAMRDLVSDKQAAATKYVADQNRIVNDRRNDIEAYKALLGTVNTASDVLNEGARTIIGRGGLGQYIPGTATSTFDWSKTRTMPSVGNHWS